MDCLGVGCPVITYDRGALSEVFEDGVDGFVVRDRVEFQRAMQKVETLDRGKIEERAWARWGPVPVGDRLVPVLIEASRGARWG